MGNYIKTFDERLLVHFEEKAKEFSKHADGEPKAAIVANQLAILYRELADIVRK